jgi:hypothetical protein
MPLQYCPLNAPGKRRTCAAPRVRRGCTKRFQNRQIWLAHFRYRDRTISHEISMSERAYIVRFQAKVCGRSEVLALVAP